MGAKYEDGDDTLVAAASFVGKQYFIAKKTGATACDIASGATTNLHGIIQEPVANGRPCRIRKRGKSLCVVDGNAGNIVVGDRLTSDANGKGVKTTTDGDVVIAIAGGAATTDGAIIEVDMPGRFDTYVA